MALPSRVAAVGPIALGLVAGATFWQQLGRIALWLWITSGM